MNFHPQQTGESIISIEADEKKRFKTTPVFWNKNRKVLVFGSPLKAVTFTNKGSGSFFTNRRSQPLIFCTLKGGTRRRGGTNSDGSVSRCVHFPRKKTKSKPSKYLVVGSWLAKILVVGW